MCYVECVSYKACRFNSEVARFVCAFCIHCSCVCVVHVCGFNKLLVYRRSIIEGKPQIGLHCVCSCELAWLIGKAQVNRFEALQF